MGSIKISDLPQKSTLESTDKVVGYSTTGGTSLLLGQAFIDVKNAAESAKSQAQSAASSATSAVSGFSATVQTAKNEITAQKTSSVAAVSSQEATSKQAVVDKQAEATSALNSAKTAAVNEVNALVAQNALVKTVAQTLSETEKNQARVNIGILEFLGKTAWFKRPSLFASAKTTVTIPVGTQVAINGFVYVSTVDTTLQVSSIGDASARAGKDVYIYACAPTSGTAPVFVLSLNSTVPTGYDSNNSRKIGGFHCLCASVGTISGHRLSGYATGDVLPDTRWDLLHRPVCESEGMAFVDILGKWVQIYLPSWDGSKLVSRYRGTIVDGSSSKAMGGEEFAYYSGISGCRLVKRDEFVVLARGSNEQTNIAGSSDPSTTGGHTDTAGRRMISNYGIEDCCGCLWQWGADMFEAMTTNWASSSDKWLSGYSWQTASVAGIESGMGSCLGLLRRVLLGADWGDGSRCGSRSALCYDFSSRSSGDYSGRLASEPRVVSL